MRFPPAVSRVHNISAVCGRTPHTKLAYVALQPGRIAVFGMKKMVLVPWMQFSHSLGKTPKLVGRGMGPVFPTGGVCNELLIVHLMPRVWVKDMCSQCKVVNKVQEVIWAGVPVQVLLRRG